MLLNLKCDANLPAQNYLHTLLIFQRRLKCFSCDFISYLFIPNVLSAAVSRGCTMLHPGYGFLAENASFVDICKEHGINFIGPNVSPSQ